MEWYDSTWLDRYFAAREMIAARSPAKATAFDEWLDVLRTDPGFEVRHVPQLIDQATLDELQRFVACLDKARLEMHELKRFGRFVVHDLPRFAQLQRDLTDQVSELAGEELEPSYNFLSLYTHRGVCEPHLDAPSAKWTLDICLAQSQPWPIHIGRVMPWPKVRSRVGENWQDRIKRTVELEFREFTTLPGEAILFSGSSQWHYRDPLPPQSGRAFCDLLFLHYIPKGTAEVIQPANWARLFDAPELAEIPGIERQL